jgi:hypothetical protein
MQVKQLSITPLELESNDSTLASDQLLNYSSDSANLSLTVKISTESAKQQIAKNIDAPQFLVDWIIPEEMYITASFSTEKGENGEIAYTNTSLSINSKTPKQSEVLLSLLISFIYPDSENMTIDELTKLCSWLGLCDAINLDGGGSSTMWCSDWGVVSYPCRNKKYDHAGDRKVSSCMLVTLKK